jgi:hypothetical protein
MIVKLIQNGDGEIDVEMSAFCLTENEVSYLIERLRGTGRCITVDRLTPDGKPLQETMILE